MPPIKREIVKKEKEKGIATVESLYRPEEELQEKKEEERYKFFRSTTKFFAKRFASYGVGRKFTPEEQEIFGFLDLEISPEEFYAAGRGMMLAGLAVGLVFASLFYLQFMRVLERNYLYLGAAVLVLIPIGVALYYRRYPKMVAEKEKLLALAYVPEIVNYLVMSMRLNPNLEKAVEFAANHGRGRISDELKKIVWLVQIGKYSSVEEAIDELAYRWGPYSEDFKQALMTVRASVLETDKAKREEYLEKAVEDVLEGSKEKMDIYARGLHQPTVFLYYFGIMLPLMLAIILPIGAAFIKNAAFAKAEVVFVIYCVLLPVGVFIYGNSILSGRPPTYVAPEIPENFPGIPKKGLIRIGGALVPYKMLALLLLVLLISLGYALDLVSIASIKEYELADALPRIPHITLIGGAAPDGTVTEEITIYVFTIFGIIMGLASAISVYLYGKYGARKKAQDEIREMEIEFKDAMYVLASRLGENRPMEDALKQALDFLPRSKVAQRVFKTILDNVSMLGMTVEAAVFDGVYGAMKNLPSPTLKSGLRIMVDSVEIGVNVAAKSLISLSMQLRNSHKIDEMLKRLLSDITILLTTMAVFVAPIVLAVVSSLQTVIINSLSGLGSIGSATTASTDVSAFGNIQLSALSLSSDVIKDSATPGQFLMIMGLYVIEIVFMLVYFNSQIEDSNNKLHTYTAIAKAIPVAALIFCVVAYFTNVTLAGVG
ncbi:MAG: type II secretion system F family protein [Candidatus Micrarchaeota archaeon]